MAQRYTNKIGRSSSNSSTNILNYIGWSLDLSSEKKAGRRRRNFKSHNLIDLDDLFNVVPANEKQSNWSQKRLERLQKKLFKKKNVEKYSPRPRKLNAAMHSTPNKNRKLRYQKSFKNTKFTTARKLSSRRTKYANKRKNRSINRKSSVVDDSLASFIVSSQCILSSRSSGYEPDVSTNSLLGSSIWHDISAGEMRKYDNNVQHDHLIQDYSVSSSSCVMMPAPFRLEWSLSDMNTNTAGQYYQQKSSVNASTGAIKKISKMSHYLNKTSSKMTSADIVKLALKMHANNDESTNIFKQTSAEFLNIQQNFNRQQISKNLICTAVSCPIVKCSARRKSSTDGRWLKYPLRSSLVDMTCVRHKLTCKHTHKASTQKLAKNSSGLGIYSTHSWCKKSRIQKHSKKPRRSLNYYAYNSKKRTTNSLSCMKLHKPLRSRNSISNNNIGAEISSLSIYGLFLPRFQKSCVGEVDEDYEMSCVNGADPNNSSVSDFKDVEPMDWTDDDESVTKFSMTSDSDEEQVNLSLYKIINANIHEMNYKKQRAIGENVDEWHNDCYYFVLDTDIILCHLEFLDELGKMKLADTKGTILFIPYCVLRELDYFKLCHVDPKIRLMASEAVAYLNEKFESHDKHFKAQNALDDKHVIIRIYTPDDYIINSCMQLKLLVEHLMLLTNDTKLRNKAIVNAINVMTKCDLVKNNKN